MTTADTDFALSGDDDDDALELQALALRRRRRLPLLTALLAVGVVAAGAFIVGAEVQKHWGTSASSGGSGTAATFASRFRGAGGTTTGTTTTGTRGGFGGGTFAGGGATIGTVTVIKGSTLYVTDTSGNTVKITTSPASTVSKTVSTNLQAVRPGDTVVVRGTQQKNGSITASSISVGTAGATGFGSGDSGGATGFGGSSSSRNGGATGFGGGGSGG